MDAPAAQVDHAAAELSLTLCPHCDYALAGLPPAGVCPECGGHYDQKFIVLSGRGRGQFDWGAGGTWRGLGVLALTVVFVVFMFGAGLRDPGTIGWTAASIAILGTQLYAWLFSPQRARTQVWFGDEGVAQTLSTHEGRRFGWLSRHHIWIYFPAAIVAGILLGPSGTQGAARVSMTRVGWVVVVLVGSALIGWIRYRRWARADAAQLTPEFTSWDRIRRHEIKGLARGRVRVRFQSRFTWWRIDVSDFWVVDAELELTREGTQELRKKVDGWLAARPATQ